MPSSSSRQDPRCKRSLRHANTGACVVDPQTPRFYIHRMTLDQTNHRFDLELKRLEKRLEELVVVCRQLQEENRSLRQRQESLMSERAATRTISCTIRFSRVIQHLFWPNSSPFQHQKLNSRGSTKSLPTSAWSTATCCTMPGCCRTRCMEPLCSITSS